MSQRSRRIGLPWALACALILCASNSLSLAQDKGGDAVPVEPAELDQKPELIGREVIVDDRVSFYVPRTGAEPDELRLKRTRTLFLVPRALRPAGRGRATAVVARGVLKREGAGLVCVVSGLTVVPADLERLERGVANLAAKDYETRSRWARWALARADEFQDEPLRKRARELDLEALRIEADMKTRGVDAPAQWLAMARDARQRKLPEPAAGALAHRALRARLASARTQADFEKLRGEVLYFFPAAPTDRASAKVDIERWLIPYANDPDNAYRTAPPAARQALDRRLWADVMEQIHLHEPTADLQAAADRVSILAAELPEKPDLPNRLLKSAVAKARENLGGLRLADARRLADLLRDTLHEPDAAREILASWLKIQRDRLSDTDAEGPVALATLHEELLQDHVTAIELLRKAWKADPTSREVAQAFRTRGFRKVKDDWVQDDSAARNANEPTPTPATGERSQSLRGLTADEVRRRLGGNPDHINYIGARGQMMEQWQYLDTKHVRFVNILHSPGDQRARVVADYTLPRASLRSPGPPR